MPRGKKFTADQIIGKLRQAAEAIATTETWGRSVRQPPTAEGVVFPKGSAWLLTVNRAGPMAWADPRAICYLPRLLSRINADPGIRWGLGSPS